jgi:hypothetical protein
MAQRSQSFAYGTKNESTSPISTSSSTTMTPPTIYPALLSRIAIELRQRITLGDHAKDDIEYKNSFDGKEVVVCINSFCVFIKKKLCHLIL